ncbi:MAG: hypothetical protein LBK40_01355 [Spirochaetaceae bacterium]|jgi:hypothetical protein|nr:hypothetical protein [Spirochaetaceae bacterium]
MLYFARIKRPQALRVLLLAALSLAAVRAGAQNFKALTTFRVIGTEHFDIIFPRESEPSARLLASYADQVYDEVSSLLGITVQRRIPVTLTPHTDRFNGYMNPIPYPHIMLFDTPMDLEWTSFADNLESLFRHELTHAVSLDTRGPFMNFLHRVFGGWVYPAGINAPLFMIEGVTVSFESLSGFGRANDPLIKQKLRQALYEGKFLTPFQASGVYDLPGQEGAWYEYGGLFSVWLQKTYGMEKYAELWQSLGRGFYFSFFVYRSGYYHYFRKVYGIEFSEAWNAFGASLALDGLEENSDELPLEGFITALAAQGNFVYALGGGKIRVYETAPRNASAGHEAPRVITVSGQSASDIAVSPDGKTLLVSGYRHAGDRALSVIYEYDAATGQKTGRSFRNLYKARYFRDGVIGLGSELHNNCIVYEDYNGLREVLFRGNEHLVFSGPQALDNERIVFIAAHRGLRRIWLYNYVSRELFRLETELPGDTELWRYARGLGVSGEKLFFGYNDDDRMYKLASVDLASMEAVWSGRDFSGGVLNPVASGDSVYYRGAFFSRDGLLRFPEGAASLSGRHSPVRLILHTGETFQDAASGGGAIPGPGVWPEKSRPYYALRYMNPFKLWLPLPLLRSDGESLSLDGGGIFSVMMDPTDRNLLVLAAYWDAAYRMAMIGMLQWQNTSLGFPLTLSFSDQVSGSGKDAYRDTRGSLSGTLKRGLAEQGGSAALSAGVVFTLNANREDAESAYQWTYDENKYAVTAGLGLSSRRKHRSDLFGTGLALNVRGTSVVSAFEPRYEGFFEASVETLFPLKLSLYGAYDRRGMNLWGVSRTYGAALFAASAPSEYPNPKGIDLSWLSGGEAALGLFSFEVQNNLSHIYTNRMFGVLALRNALYDSRDLPDAEGAAFTGDLRLAQSILARFGMVYAVIPVKALPLYIEPNIWYAWKFSNAISGRGSLWNFGLGFNVRY